MLNRPPGNPGKASGKELVVWQDVNAYQTPPFDCPCPVCLGQDDRPPFPNDQWYLEYQWENLKTG